jgi:hypothetical protein
VKRTPCFSTIPFTWVKISIRFSFGAFIMASAYNRRRGWVIFVVENTVANALTNCDVNIIRELVHSCLYVVIHYSFHETTMILQELQGVSIIQDRYLHSNIMRIPARVGARSSRRARRRVPPNGQVAKTRPVGCASPCEAGWPPTELRRSSFRRPWVR